MFRVLLIAVLMLLPLTAPLSARSPADVAEVRNGLLAVAVGNMIQENCSRISPRLIRVYTLRNQLIAAARSAGFSDAEIEAFVDDPIARENLKAEARGYLAQRGLENPTPAAYCIVGRAEIDQKTAVGRLLRSR